MWTDPKQDTDADSTSRSRSCRTACTHPSTIALTCPLRAAVPRKLYRLAMLYRAGPSYCFCQVCDLLPEGVSGPQQARVDGYQQVAPASSIMLVQHSPSCQSSAQKLDNESQGRSLGPAVTCRSHNACCLARLDMRCMSTLTQGPECCEAAFVHGPATGKAFAPLQEGAASTQLGCC